MLLPNLTKPTLVRLIQFPALALTSPLPSILPHFHTEYFIQLLFSPCIASTSPPLPPPPPPPPISMFYSSTIALESSGWMGRHAVLAGGVAVRQPCVSQEI